MAEIYYNTTLSSYTPVTIDSICPAYPETHGIVRENGFPYALFLTTVAGGGELFIDGKTFLLPPGAGVLIAADYPYAYQPSQEYPDWQTSFFAFSGDLVTPIEKLLNMTDYLLLPADVGGFTQNTIESWYSLLTQQRELLDYPALAVEVLQFFNELKKHIFQQKTGDALLFREVIQPVQSYIRHHYSEKILIKDIAATINVSQQYLDRIFNSYFGFSPSRYLRNYRIAVAKKMLIQEPGLSVTEIGLQTGFSSTSQFISHFKAAYNTTPKKYRARYATTTVTQTF